ncbi:MAG: hypothetical protein NVS2B16_04680 [Chloroflexota bacterium]
MTIHRNGGIDVTQANTGQRRSSPGIGKLCAVMAATALILAGAAVRPNAVAHAHGSSAFTITPSHSIRGHGDVVSLRSTLSSLQRRFSLHAVPAATHVHSAAMVERLSRAVTDAQKLQIPASSFPANAINKTSTTLPGKSVDDPAKGVLFTDPVFHRQAYGTHGVLGAYDQSAQINFGHYDNFVSMEWLGSYYSSAQFAASRVDDAVNTLAFQHIQGQSCYINDEPNCHIFIWDIFGNYLVYAVWSNDNAVGELAFLSSPLLGPGSMLANQDALGQDFQTLLSAGDAAIIAAGANAGQTAPASGPPPQPTVVIDKLELLHIIRGRYKPTRTIHVNETASFLAYFHVSSVGTYDASGHFKFYSPKARLVMTAGDRSLFDGKPQQQITPAGLFYFDQDGTFTDTSAQGKVTEQFTVTLGASKDTKSMDLTVGPPLGTTLRS